MSVPIYLFIYFLMIFLFIMKPINAEVTLRDMLPPSPNASLYWAPKCVDNICILTGLGGIVSVWMRHVDENRGKIFIVSGICASACELAYQRAKENRELIFIEDNSQLIPHPKSPTLLK